MSEKVGTLQYVVVLFCQGEPSGQRKGGGGTDRGSPGETSGLGRAQGSPVDWGEPSGLRESPEEPSGLRGSSAD